MKVYEKINSLLIKPMELEVMKLWAYSNSVTPCEINLALDGLMREDKEFPVNLIELAYKNCELKAKGTNFSVCYRCLLKFLETELGDKK